MVVKTWTGVDQDWHTGTNWTPNGVPTSSDDVIIDGSGYVLCWANSPIECNDFTIEATATESNLFDQGGIIYGDFLQHAGYFAPVGGGGYTMEFKGNWEADGGTFAVGTGVGVDPTCDFSGVTKTYAMNHGGTASYQNVLFSGSYTLNGSKLSQMYIAQNLDVSGTLTIYGLGATIKQIDLAGLFNSLSGTIDGGGRVVYTYDEDASMPTGGSIECSYFQFLIDDPNVTINPREYSTKCKVEVDFKTADNKIELDNSGLHEFLGGLEFTDDNEDDAEFDCETQDGQMWVSGTYKVHTNAFANNVFTIKFGNKTHVFTGRMEFFFAGTGVANQFVVDAGEGILLQKPPGRQAVPEGKGLGL